MKSIANKFYIIAIVAGILAVSLRLYQAYIERQLYTSYLEVEKLIAIKSLVDWRASDQSEPKIRKESYADGFNAREYDWIIEIDDDDKGRCDVARRFLVV